VQRPVNNSFRKKKQLRPQLFNRSYHVYNNTIRIHHTQMSSHLSSSEPSAIGILTKLNGIAPIPPRAVHSLSAVLVSLTCPAAEYNGGGS